MKLGVLVLNWNGLSDTRACLDSLLPVPNWVQIYVVDNGSADNSVCELKSEYGTQITVIETGANLLFAGGNNYGIRVAMQDGCDAVLLLNNDTTVEKSTLSSLFEAANRHPGALLCPKILYWTTRDIIWYAGGIWENGRISHRGIRARDEGQFDHEELTAWGTGCALWIPRKVIDKIGLLDEEFKLYYEDVEYCLRAKQAEVDTFFVPSSRVWHKVSASLGGHGSLRKQKRKFNSLGLLMGKIGVPPFVRLAAYIHLFLLDPVRAIFAKLVNK